MPKRQSGEFAIFFTKLVAMATYLAKSENKVQINHLHPKSNGKKIAKIGPVHPEIFDKICQFFGHVSPDVHKVSPPSR